MAEEGRIAARQGRRGIVSESFVQTARLGYRARASPGSLPQLKDLIRAPYNIGPDSILDAAIYQSIEFDKVLLYDPLRGNPEGRGDIAFGDYEKLELFDAVFAARPPAPGPLWFISDECFGSHEPYLVHGEHLRDFVDACPCQLNGDVLFIWCETPRLTVIHHSGAFFHVLLPTTRS